MAPLLFNKYSHVLISWIFSSSFLSFTLHQPTLVMGALNGIEACENPCFNRSQCDKVGGGSCCIWDSNGDSNGYGRCRSNIGESICIEEPQQNASLSLLPSMNNSTPQIDCPPMIFPTQSTPRSLQSKFTNTMSQAEVKTETPTQQSETTYEKCKHLVSQDYLECLGFSISDIKLNVIISKIVSYPISILGSSYVIQDVLRDPQKRTESTFHRLMVGLSVSDIINSLFGFLGTWIMPKGESVFAIGSNASCAFGGFFLFLTACSTPLYNCSLVTYYLLQIRFQWVGRRIRAFEKWLHIVPWTIGLVAAIVGVAMNKLGPNSYFCG